MLRYSEQVKQSILERMLHPAQETVDHIAKETGIPKKTLYKWQKEMWMRGEEHGVAPKNVPQWSSREKFDIVMEVETLSEAEKREYCQQKGLHVEQVAAWRDACMQAIGGIAQQTIQLRQQLEAKKREHESLQQELKRKEAALAEAKALLELEKKAPAIWGDKADE